MGDTEEGDLWEILIDISSNHVSSNLELSAPAKKGAANSRFRLAWFEPDRITIRCRLEFV